MPDKVNNKEGSEQSHTESQCCKHQILVLRESGTYPGLWALMDLCSPTSTALLTGVHMCEQGTPEARFFQWNNFQVNLQFYVLVTLMAALW